MLNVLSLKKFLENKGKFIALGLLIIMLILELSSAVLESQIIDEGVHLTAGYSYLVTHDIQLNPEHPPLVKLISAALIWPLHPNFPWQDLTDANQWDIAGKFFYDLDNNADLMLFLGRLPIMFYSLLLGWLIFTWTRKISNTTAGLFALSLFVFDSNILAHSRYITTDIAISLGFLATLYFFCQYIKKQNTTNFLLLLLVFALTQITKFSALMLWPIILTAAVISKLKFKQIISLALGLGIMTFWIIFFSYFGELNHYFDGLKALADHEKGGHYSYLLGQYHNNGFWNYFPVAFLVKTPLTTIILLLISLIFFIIKKTQTRSIIFSSVDYYLIMIFPIFYFIVSMINRINIGIRHLLPIYPFLFILIAIIIFQPHIKNKIIKYLAVLLLIVYIIESLFVYPNYLSYFSSLIGGSNQGNKYLLDSNLDWGQDLKKLKEYLVRNNINEQIYLAYFGKASPDYYKINYLPYTSGIKKGLIAISIQTIMSEGENFYWLLEQKPIAKIGSTIYLYRL